MKYTPEQQRDLIIIGGGSAGLISAYLAALMGSRVSLVERHRMGGDCLNTGCVPSKTLISTTRFLAACRDSARLGVRKVDAEWDFGEIMQRIRSVIETIAPHDSVARYRSLGVDVLEGDARVLSANAVEVDGQTYTTRRLLIATGARPFVPPIEGVEQLPYLTSDTIWDLEVLPQRLLVLGGGPIGCELAQCFARLGSQVTLVEMADRVLFREDANVTELLEESLRRDGIELLTGHQAKRFYQQEGQWLLDCKHGDAVQTVAFDQALIAVGRAPNTRDLDAEALGIELARNGAIVVDDRMQSTLPGVYACGDVAGPYQFTHAAGHQAWYATSNALFAPFYRPRISYRVLPATTYTEPEVSRVGLNEQEAKVAGIAYEVAHFSLAELDRAVAENLTEGFVKILTVPGKDRILGCTIVGANAGELIAEQALAMQQHLGLGKILGTVHAYPGWAEANKLAAGAWRKAHTPAWLGPILRRYHGWRR